MPSASDLSAAEALRKAAEAQYRVVAAAREAAANSPAPGGPPPQAPPPPSTPERK